jgi:anti-sigma28 factor (negative regulator of flagellin synthesis)
MATMKHIGRVDNTGMKCVVVFREIYDEKGNVSDDKNCLVVETERLPDMEHDDMVRVVESDEAQSAPEFFEIAHRSMFSDGTNMLQKLHNAGYLRKFPTDQIILTPNNHTSIPLKEINEIIRKQKTGMSESDIQNSMVDDTDSAPRQMASNQKLDPTQTIDQAIDTGEQAMDETAIAKNLLSQAETFLAEAERLKSEAYEMAPDLKPRRGRPKKVNVDANT